MTETVGNLKQSQHTTSMAAFLRLLILSPIAAAAYYLALKFAFVFSLADAVKDASDVFPPFSLGPTWGSHWLYRLFAEVASVAFGTFVAGGLARKNGRLAGLIGGLSISFFYLLRNSYILFTLFYIRSETTTITEPWFQHAIEWLIVVTAPLIGIMSGVYGQKWHAVSLKDLEALISGISFGCGS
jgi:hypothetical protein